MLITSPPPPILVLLLSEPSAVVCLISKFVAPPFKVLTVILATSIGLLKSHSSLVESYVIVAPAPPIVIPAPFAAAASAASVAILKLRSSIATVV